jgi:hypothetical protein
MVYKLYTSNNAPAVPKHPGAGAEGVSFDATRTLAVRPPVKAAPGRKENAMAVELYCDYCGGEIEGNFATIEGKDENHRRLHGSESGAERHCGAMNSGG